MVASPVSWGSREWNRLLGLTTNGYFCSFLGKEDLVVASDLVFPRLAAAQDSHSSQRRAGDTC